MSMYSKIREEKQSTAVKACPKCHRIMKSAVVKGKKVWICPYCRNKVEAAKKNE